MLPSSKAVRQPSIDHMCGLAGIFDPRSSSLDALQYHVQAMADAIVHRGPDDHGVWCDPAGIALGFRRLAILDLTPAGHQPMISASGRYIIAYNGEIYNFEHLRNALDATSPSQWRGHSDTEVLLALIERGGVVEALPQLDGMFAIALWDRQERKLTLARDRFGEKPLYYGRAGSRFVFTSELKALRRLPGWQPLLDQAALSLFLRHGWIPSPACIYAGISKLPPGSFVTVDAAGEATGPTPFWSAPAEVAKAADNPFRGSEAEAVDEAERLIRHSVDLRMVSDVPLGAFLSGGIDSSTVVAMMRASGRAVRTFTIGFPGWANDEAPHAAAVARHLGTQHVEVPLTEQDCLDLVPRLPEIFDEPFADPSQLPTSLLCRATRPYVTVALSGDGGDELFGGYSRYWTAEREWGEAQALPTPLRSLAQMTTSLLSGQEWRPLRRLRRNLQPYTRMSPELLYQDYLSWWLDEDRLFVGQPASSQWFTQPGVLQQIKSLPLRFMALDAATYLPDDLETKIDRASMAVSLEARAPLLQPDLARFAWSLPLDMKIKNNKGKHLLRQVLYRHVPPELVDRPKQGFEPPLRKWLEGPLRTWADDLIGSKMLDCGGLIDPAPVRKRWLEHRSGRRNWAFPLWVVIMLQAWLRTEKGF